jgi:hypothetical protein
VSDGSCAVRRLIDDTVVVLPPRRYVVVPALLLHTLQLEAMRQLLAAVLKEANAHPGVAEQLFWQAVADRLSYQKVGAAAVG